MAASSSSAVPVAASIASEEAVAAPSETIAITSSDKTAAKILKLKTSDDEIVEVEQSFAMQCDAIKRMVDDGCADAVIPVSNVDSETLEMVLEWCEHHVSGAGKVSAEEMKKWEDDFVDCDTTVLYHLIMAANYLEAKALLDRVAQKVADMIKGKHPDEIRKEFNIKNDFEPEEYEKIISDHSWAFTKADD